MTIVTPLARAVLAVILLAFATGTQAHEGHSHGEQPKAAAPANGVPRLEAVSGPFELVAVLRAPKLVIYLDRFASNEPVAGADVTVETPGGSQQAEFANGVYTLDAPWASVGSVDLIFTVTANGNSEVLTGTLAGPESAQAAAGQIRAGVLHRLKDALGFASTLLLVLGGVVAGALGVGLTRRTKVLAIALLASAIGALASDVQAHEGHDHGNEKRAPVAQGDNSQRLPDGALLVPKHVQRILAIRTVVSEESQHQKTIELPGRIIPDPNASGYVQAAVSGRLSAPPAGFPKLGTSVKAGDVLAFVTPPFQAIDVSDMRQKAGELDQQIGIVEKRIARYEPLAKSGAVTKVTHDEAVLELKGLRERRAALDRTRIESEKLVAPVSGILASANAVAGQIAETNAIVFHIVDPSRLWVEALTFNALPEAGAATARTGEGAALTLSFQGAGLTDRSQAVPVHFAVENPPKGLRVGQLVTVMATSGQSVSGIAVPRASVLRSANGQMVLFEHTSAERFEPRIVRVEPLDAERVLVLDGLSPGKRVVVQGAELLNQIR